MALGDNSTHSLGMEQLTAAQKIAHARRGEKPAGEYRLGAFIAETDAAFEEIDRLLGEAGMNLVPKARSNLKGGT